MQTAQKHSVKVILLLQALWSQFRELRLIGASPFVSSAPTTTLRTCLRRAFRSGNFPRQHRPAVRIHLNSNSVISRPTSNYRLEPEQILKECMRWNMLIPTETSMDKLTGLTFSSLQIQKRPQTMYAVQRNANLQNIVLVKA